MAAYKLTRGTTLPLVLTMVRTGAPGVAAQPIDISDYHVLFTVRLTPVDGTSDSVVPPVWQGDNTVLGGVTLAPQTGATLGVCYVTIPASATQALPNPFPPVRLVYDVVVNDGSGNVSATEDGTILLSARVGLTQP
jgi:hypothetical protein